MNNVFIFGSKATVGSLNDHILKMKDKETEMVVVLSQLFRTGIPLLGAGVKVCSTQKASDGSRRKRTG